VDAEQRKFLSAKFRKASLQQPDLKRLKTMLLRRGGTFVVAPARPDSDVPALLDSGFVMEGSLTMKKMNESMCHRNVASVWKVRRYGIIGIGTGYALSEDGLWRQHSWGLLRDGLLETTVKREMYFGILLQGDRADHFAKCHP